MQRDEWPCSNAEERNVSERSEREEQTHENHCQPVELNAPCAERQKRDHEQECEQKWPLTRILKIRRKKFRHVLRERGARGGKKNFAVKVIAKRIHDRGSSRDYERSRITTGACNPDRAFVSRQPRFGKLADDVHRDHCQAVEPSSVQVRPHCIERDEVELALWPLRLEQKKRQSGP